MTTDPAHADPIAREHATALRAALDDGVADATRGCPPRIERALGSDAAGRRARGAETACLLAAVAPRVAARLTDTLVGVATGDTDERARRKAAHALVRVARAAPEAVAPHAERLVSLVSDDDPQVAGTAAGLSAALADHRPETVAAVAGSLGGLVSRGEPARVIEAAEALGSLAAVDPSAAAVARPELVERLGAERPDVAAAAARALAPQAEAAPGEFDQPEQLADALATLRATQPGRLDDGCLDGAIRALRRSGGRGSSPRRPQETERPER